MLFRRKKLDDALYYQRVFGSDDGKIVLADLVKKNNVLSNTFNEDSHRSAFNQGRRDAILEILAILNIDIEEAFYMLEQDALRTKKFQEQGE